MIDTALGRLLSAGDSATFVWAEYLFTQAKVSRGGIEKFVISKVLNRTLQGEAGWRRKLNALTVS